MFYQFPFTGDILRHSSRMFTGGKIGELVFSALFLAIPVILMTALSRIYEAEFSFSDIF